MKDGYYWVKYDGRWFIAICASEKFGVHEIEEIGDYIETPDKYKDN